MPLTLDFLIQYCSVDHKVIFVCHARFMRASGCLLFEDYTSLMTQQHLTPENLQT
jgi:hypothetical protein